MKSFHSARFSGSGYCLLTSGAQTAAPTVTDPDLAVRTVVSGLTQPIAIAFLGHNDFLVTEKSTGRVKRVSNGVVRETVLDLPVNFGSERGLLGIALHPDFRRNGWVYLFWTREQHRRRYGCARRCRQCEFAVPPGTPSPLGNRVDRFVWNGQAQKLTFDRNIAVLRAFQADAGQPERAITTAASFDLQKRSRGRVVQSTVTTRRLARSRDDEREQLFIIVGDTGRRGVLQNLMDGPSGPASRRSIRRAGARQRAPHRRRAATQRRRLDAA